MRKHRNSSCYHFRVCVPLDLQEHFKDKKDFTICHSVINNIIPHYLDTYFTICTESHFESREESGNAIGFTEKTWKPILNFHPFIYVLDKFSKENCSATSVC